jgi:putative permease
VLAQVPSVLGLTIYLVLVPFSVFFFLRDRDQIIAWVASQLPRERPLLDQVGSELNVQIANYVRGKAVEILIVGSVTFVVFTILGLNYAALLGVIVGLSVLVPFIGAAVATLPVALVGVLQWGWSLELVYVLGAYMVIQALDGNVLLPLLLGEAVDLHPIAIIVAVLVFGGLWGFWGVFFAIPLATLFKAVSNAWPRHQLDQLVEPAAVSAEVAAAGAPQGVNPEAAPGGNPV